MNSPQAVNEQNFQQQVIESNKPVLVDFWAPWCGPCRAIAPTLEDLAADYEAISIVKLDVDESPSITAGQGVRSIPTLKLFKNGKVMETLVGNQSRGSLEALLLKYV